MFDVSFGELLLVLIIGLIVLGPARLPTAIKTVVGWINVLRRLSANVQLELNKELKLQELQQSLKQAEQSGLDTITPEIQASIEELKRITESLQKDFNYTQQDVNSMNKMANETQTETQKNTPSEIEKSTIKPNESTNQVGKQDGE